MNRSGAAVLLFGTLFAGWLYVSGRLTGVLDAIKGQPAMAATPSAPVAPRRLPELQGPPYIPTVPGLPPARPRDVAPGTPGIPTLPPAGMKSIEVRGPKATIPLTVVPGSPQCWAEVYAAALAAGIPERNAREVATFQCRG